MRLEHVRQHHVGVTGAQLEIELSVYNPNPEPLPFEAVTFDLRLGDSHPVHGHATFDAPLPPMEAVPLLATVDVSIPAAVSIARAVAEGRDDYVLEGIMALEYRGHREVPFERTGSLSDALAVAPGGAAQ